MTAQEAVQKVLTHIERHAGTAGPDFRYDALLALPRLPMEALGKLGGVTRLDDPGNAESLPSLLMDVDGGQVQLEVCPFGPLALLTSDGAAETDGVAQALADAGILPLFPQDLDTAGEWHGAPLARWLFPRRLTDALTLFDGLRGR